MLIFDDSDQTDNTDNKREVHMNHYKNDDQISETLIAARQPLIKSC